MPQTTTGRPAPAEHDPFYNTYIRLVPDGDISETLEREGTEALDFLAGIAEEQGEFRYAPEKWSIKELIGHVIDAERIFCYRALRFARNDRTPLPGWEQEDFVRAAGSNQRTLASLVEEFRAVRQASVLLLRSFEADMWSRAGVANEKNVSVRAIAYIMAGHELHHRGILKERYLQAAHASAAK